MSFLFYLPVVAVATLGLWNFTQVEKTYQSDKPLTDAQRVAKLYREIKKMKCAQQSSDKMSWCSLDAIQLNCSTAIETVKTVAKYKYQNLLSLYCTPEKLGDRLLVIPYYLGGNWHKAVVKHTNNNSRIIKIKTIDINKEIDVTERVKSYMGPSENFYGHDVTPEMLGYGQLIFYIMTGVVIEVKRVEEDEVINHILA